MAKPRLSYEVHGSEGPCILWVHGLLSARSLWMPNLAAFNDRYRSIVVELLGHGRSPAPEDAVCYAPDQYVEEFDRIRAAVGADRWYTVGQSLGGTLSLRYGIQHPDRVIAQAFTNSSTALGGDALFQNLRESMQRLAQALLEQGRSALDASHLNPARARSFADPIKQALMQDFALHSPWGIAMTALFTQPYLAQREALAQNRIPILLIAGVHEEPFRELRRYAEANVPNLNVHSLDAGHAPNLQQPEEFNRVLRAFFNLHPA